MPEWLLNAIGNVPNYALAVFKKVNKGGLAAMATFVLGIIKNIYFIIAVPALIVAYRFFKILKEKGIIDEFQNILNTALDSILSISTQCFPLITDLNAMLSCINGVH